MTGTVNELWGRFVEWTVRLWLSLEIERELFYDAVTDEGELVEIKSCIRRTDDGECGKYFIREENHVKLVESGGYYAFAVYDPAMWKRGPVLAVKMVPAEWVDDLQEYQWTNNGGRRGETVIRPRWNVVFPPEDIPGEKSDGAAAGKAVP